LHDVVEPLPEYSRIDRIYNLACPASPPAYQSDPIKTLMTNVLGASNLLDLAEKTGARILQASTSEIYGDPERHPQPEDYHGNVPTMGKRACYDEGKRCAETLFYDYHRARGVEIRVARIFNTFGPEMRLDDGRVISNFIQQAIAGKDLTVYGDGSFTRSFCYVDDMIEGLVRLMEYDGAFPGPINLGNPCEISIGDLAKRVLELTGSPSGVSYLAEAEDDPHIRRPDISKATQLLGWEPAFSLDRGLQPTIEYFRRVLKQTGTRTRPSLLESSA
jgi:UDP-glucuronate decarboxylase